MRQLFREAIDDQMLLTPQGAFDGPHDVPTWSVLLGEIVPIPFQEMQPYTVVMTIAVNVRDYGIRVLPVSKPSSGGNIDR